MIKVVNKKGFKVPVGCCSYYIGRPSLLGNPFKVGRDGNLEQVIEKYRRWLWGQIQDFGDVFEVLKDLLHLSYEHDVVYLECWCKPLACHGDVIVKALRWLQSQRNN